MKTTQDAAPAKISALLFDFGGTLAFLDFDAIATEFSRPYRKLDPLKLEHAEYAGRAALDHHLMSGKSRDPNAAYEDFFRAWMDAAGIPPEEFEHVSQRFREMHTEACMWRIVRDGTHDALERLKAAGYKLGIVSNADGRVAADCKRLGLAPFFDVIIDSQVVGVEKPDPKIFQLALEALKVAPEQALYAGDIYTIDMLGARAAGVAGKLIDQHDMYHWIEHPKIRHVRHLHPLD
ncbi:MAG TPA: HAD family hydrolase [Candidatus Binataceae bacterium]|nr:HAD family hydrolase [Candidatus Binataceae bacterium]